MFRLILHDAEPEEDPEGSEQRPLQGVPVAEGVALPGVFPLPPTQPYERGRHDDYDDVSQQPPWGKESPHATNVPAATLRRDGG